MREYDYVIVGAGPAGCCLAARLSEDPDVSVLLLEAGGSDRHPYIHVPAGFAKLTGTSHTWGYSTAPQREIDGRAMWYPQGRVLGGGSSINAMIYARGNAKDYDAWAEAGCAGWTFADVLPYFKRPEDNERFHNDYHGSGGPLGVSDPVRPLPISGAFLRAAQQAGLPFNPDFNGAVQEGCGYYQVTNRNARRCSGAVAYLRPTTGRSNLTVQTRAMATRVVVENGRAIGVDYRRRGKAATVRSAHEVIVAAGAIGSPKLLMLSGIGRGDDLKALGIDVIHDLPGVGQNLQDHFDVYVVSECRGDFSYDKLARPHRALWAVVQYLLFRQGPIASTLIDAGGFWYADPDARAPDIQMHFVLGAGLEHGLAKLRNAGVTLNSCFSRPRSRGTVTLRDADPRTAPVIDPNYWGNAYDREMSLRGFRLAREIMAQEAFRPFILCERYPGPDVQSDADIADYARKVGKTDYHPVGTCKMGSDELAVVDPALRVRGLEGLRVIDSSVMPALPSSNTNAATIMVAEKGADHVRGLI
ncbi:MAG: FAD-dependent oxidoreductase [Rhodospirillales bacterium]|nr:FAD-dependent oxidoreductase [Rhodospirillales bacterium]